MIFSNALEFHTLELPEFRPSSDTIGECPSVEKWLYFLQRAEDMEASELSAQLGEPAFTEAVVVLEMISRSPEGRQFYEARQKFLHDEQARLIAARQEGREEGRTEGEQIGIAKGKLVGRLQTLQDLLGDTPTPDLELNALDVTALELRIAELQSLLRKRNSS